MADDIKFVIGVDDRDLIKAQKEQVKFQRNLVTIEKAYRKGDITASRYNAELAKQAKQLQTLGGSYRTANSEVRKFAYQLRQADDATLSQTEAMAFAGKRVNRLGVNLQQAGYQIGDFAVQVQGGTNVMVALGQQGAQLAGIFGPAGAIAGAGLAIATAFLAPLMKVRDEAKKAADATEDFEGRVKSLDQALRDYARTKKAVTLGLTPEELTAQESLEKELEGLKKAKAELQKIDDIISNSFKVGAGEAAAGLALGQLLGLLPNAKDVETAEEAIVAAEERIVKLQAQIRQEAREEAEAILNEQLAEQQRQQALAEYEAGQKVLEERKSWISEATKIFRDAQKRMRDEEVTLTERSLDRLFANRTLFYKIRFQGDAEVMSQAVEASGKFKPKQSFEELVKMGYDPEVLKGLGLKPKRTKPSGGGSKVSPAEQIEKFMSQLEQANAVQRERIFLGEESARVTELVNKYKEAGIPLDMKRIQNLAREEQELQKLQSAHTSLTDALMSVVDGTQSVGDAFKGLIREMILDIYRERVAKSFATSVLGLFGFANGGVFSGGSQVNAFADGGVVGGPTYFPMSGGQTGLMGEAGPEAIMPLKRGADGKLGVQMNGGGEQVVVNQNINISTGVQQTVRNEIKSMMPQIAAQSKSAVLDAKRRGGSYGGKF